MKEKLSSYVIDISKYVFTGVFITSLIKNIGDANWLICALSVVISAGLLLVGLLLIRKTKKL
jgi:hypothetical protein